MNILSLAHFFVFTVYLVLMIFVLVKNPGAKLNRVCALFILSLAVWNFGDAFLHSAELKHNVMLWENFASLGWASFASLFLWQTLILTDKRKILQRPLFYVVIFFFPALFIYMQWSGFLINDFVQYSWGWNTVWGESMWSAVFYVYYTIFIFIAIALLINYSKKTDWRYKKRQAALIYIPALITFFSGTATNVLLPRLDIYGVPPIAPLITIIWAGGVVLAITRYGLMSITPQTAAADILSSMSNALMLVNPEKKIVTVNRALEMLLGYEEAELAGKPAAMVFSEEDNLFEKAGFKSLLEKGLLRNHRVSYRTKSGDNIPVSLTASVMRHKTSELMGIVCIGYDLREIVKKNRQIKDSYKRQLQMKEKLVRQEELAMVGRLAGSIGHEVRTSLSSIKNAVFYLKEYAGIKEEDSKNYLDILTDEIAHAEEVMEALMDFSGTTKINPSEVDIGEIVEKIVDLHRPGEKIEIVREIPDEARTLRADPIKLEQMLKNIILNARQAIKDTGTVKIRTEKKPSGINIHIEDTGGGMDQKTLSNLFKPLYTTKASGAGLGSTLAKDIADAHGWEIEVESEKGQGTTVTIKT